MFSKKLESVFECLWVEKALGVPLDSYPRCFQLKFFYKKAWLGHMQLCCKKFKVFLHEIDFGYVYAG